MRHLPCLLLLLTTGCLQPDPAPRFTPAWEPFDPTRGEWLSTGKALLIADCQMHNLLSQALPERNLSAEAAAGTAIRPPQLDLFSADVLEWILTHDAADTNLVLHLGDALDVACEGEFDTFLRVMERAGKPWFMAPGNHDMYYMGTYHTEDQELWQAGCFHSGDTMPKDRFIRAYVAAMVRQKEPGCAALTTALGLGELRDETVAAIAEQVPDEFEWEMPAASPGHLRRIQWKIHRDEPWRSFIIQCVSPDLVADPRFSAQVLMLDSCQYNRMPGLIPNAWMSYPLHVNCGFTGEMLPDQLRAVRRWVEQGTQTNSFVILCHHPFDDLAPRTRSSLGWLWREHRIGMMVSGHTHAGYFAHHDVGGADDVLELNLGSTTDWPMEWRTLQAFVNPTEQKIYIQAPRHTLVGALAGDHGYFDLDWEIPLGAPDDYRKYKVGEAATALLVDFYLAHHLVPYWLPQPHVRPNAAARHTEEQVKDTLLWTYHRLVQYFPTDTSNQQTVWPQGCSNDRQLQDRILALTGKPDAMDEKILFLAQLDAFERSRSSIDRETRQSSNAERARYKISQAAWASRFEAEHGRRLRLEDELIRVRRRNGWEQPADPPPQLQTQPQTQPTQPQTR